MRKLIQGRFSKVGIVLLSIVAVGAMVNLSAAADDTNVLAPSLLAYNGFENINNTKTGQAGGLNVVDPNPPTGVSALARSYGGGDRFDIGTQGSNGSMAYVSSNNHTSGTDIRISSYLPYCSGWGCTPPEAGSSFVGWNQSTLNPSNVKTPYWASMKIFLTQRPDGNNGNLKIMTFSNSNGTNVGSIQIMKDDTIGACNANLNCGVASNGVKVQTGQWYRITAKADPSGNIIAKLYNDPSSTSENDTSTINAVNGAPAVHNVNFGNIYYGASLNDMFIDSLQVSDTGLPGPYSTPGTNGQFNVNENFEKQTLGDFNIHSDDYTFSPLTQGGSSFYACAVTPPMTANDTFHFCTHNYGSSSQSFAKMTQAVFGDNKRAATLTFKYRYDGPCDVGTDCADNRPVLTVFNTDPVRFGTGGSLSLWLSKTTSNLHGALQAQDCFDSGVPIAAGTVHTISVTVYYRANNTSSATITLDGTLVGAMNSTTPNGNFYANGDGIESILFGPNSYIPNYKASYDNVTLATNTAVSPPVTPFNTCQ